MSVAGVWDLTIEKFLLKRTGTRIGTLIYPRVSEDENKISNRSSARSHINLLVQSPFQGPAAIEKLKIATQNVTYLLISGRACPQQRLC